MTKCGVKGCRTGRPKDTPIRNAFNLPRLCTFSLPKDLSRKNAWLKNIPYLKKNSFVCELHFDSSFVSKSFDPILLKNGDIVQISKAKAGLNKDAVPVEDIHHTQVHLKTPSVTKASKLKENRKGLKRRLSDPSSTIDAEKVSPSPPTIALYHTAVFVAVNSNVALKRSTSTTDTEEISPPPPPPTNSKAASVADVNFDTVPQTSTTATSIEVASQTSPAALTDIDEALKQPTIRVIKKSIKTADDYRPHSLGKSKIDNLKDQLNKFVMPMGWSRVLTGDKIFFFLNSVLHKFWLMRVTMPADSEPTVCTQIGREITMDVPYTFPQLYSYLENLGKRKVCSGYGLNEAKFSPGCSGFLPETNKCRRTQFPACDLCRREHKNKKSRDAYYSKSRLKKNFRLK